MFSKFNFIRFLKIDFNKAWWDLFYQQKWLVLVIAIMASVMQITWSLIPFFVAYMFELKSYLFCTVLFVMWLLWDSIYYIFMSKVNYTFQLSCIHTVYQQAHKKLITIDPQYHIHRSSGAILAKIERAARGYEDLADYVTFQYIPLFVGIITVIVALATTSLMLAFIMSLFAFIIILLGYYVGAFLSPAVEQKFIKTDDKFKGIATENLSQIQLVRSTFATDLRYYKLNEAIKENVYSELKVWLFYSGMSATLQKLYIFSLFILAMYLLWQINSNIESVPVALGLFIAYLQSSRDLVRVSGSFRKTMRSINAIKDLFDFIPNFGKENFPVFGNEISEIIKHDDYSIKAKNLYFDYGKAKLFNNHSFELKSLKDQTNKLYGIIGPSGSGKSTLISLLGGQLKPIQGTIEIDNVDIYTVSDAQRRKLIALQGQISTNLKGVVKDSLLLGIPENNYYSDQYLINILARVGLWFILENQEGLSTLLGEGGLNLSGGQRQRLNFAALYLRAKYHKPSVIFIDEPTSSLDELSESAITQMIKELSKDAITLVIAHRLKTIQDAQGLIELSLLSREKEINIYTHEELLQKSHYYQQLLLGKVEIGK